HRQEQVEDILCGDAAVVTASGAHVECAYEAVLDVDVTALVAFLPGVGRNLEPDPFGRARLTLFLEPSHSENMGRLEGDNLGGGSGTRQPRRCNSLSQLSVTRLARLPRHPERDPHGERASQQE